jgi:hypothetical protein
MNIERVREARITPKPGAEAASEAAELIWSDLEHIPHLQATKQHHFNAKTSYTSILASSACLRDNLTNKQTRSSDWPNKQADGRKQCLFAYWTPCPQQGRQGPGQR